MIQLISLAGAIAILAAYIANLLRFLETSDRTYLLLNIAGAGALTAVALLERQWGFLLLESVWTIASLVSLLRKPPAATQA